MQITNPNITLSISQLEEAQLLATRQMCAVVGVSSLIFGGITLWVNAPIHIVFLAVGLSFFCLVGGLVATTRQRYIIDRVISFVSISTLVEISVFNPNIATSIISAPLLLHVLYTERNSIWRFFFIIVLIISFLWSNYQSTVLGVISLGYSNNVDFIIEFHCIVSAIICMIIIAINRKGNLKLVDTAKEFTLNLIEKVAIVEQTNEDLYHSQRRLLDTKAKIKNLILKDQETIIRVNASREQLNQFAFAAGHDLKEPIRTIQSFTQLVRRNISPEIANDAILVEHFNYVATSCDAMYALLEKLLIYQRICEVQEEPQVLSVAYLWHEAINLVLDSMITLRSASSYNKGLSTEKLLGLKKKHELPISLKDTSMGFVKMSLSQAEVLFAEVVKNAITYHDDVRPVVVNCRVRPMDNGMLELVISDNGIGIEKKYHDQVFEMFKRLHTREVYAGSGLGLTLAKRIVTKYKGDIWLDSHPDEGTSVHMQLPLG